MNVAIRPSSRPLRSRSSRLGQQRVVVERPAGRRRRALVDDEPAESGPSGGRRPGRTGRRRSGRRRRPGRTALGGQPVDHGRHVLVLALDRVGRSDRRWRPGRAGRSRSPGRAAAKRGRDGPEGGVVGGRAVDEQERRAAGPRRRGSALGPVRSATRRSGCHRATRRSRPRSGSIDHGRGCSRAPDVDRARSRSSRRASWAGSPSGAAGSSRGPSRIRASDLGLGCAARP